MTKAELYARLTALIANRYLINEAFAEDCGLGFPAYIIRFDDLPETSGSVALVRELGADALVSDKSIIFRIR